MKREEELEEFISRAQEELQEEAKELYNTSRDKINKKKREYFLSASGKAAKKKGWQKRAKILREMTKLISPQEKEAIRQFYSDCPDGYEIDHIIPFCKGGLHKLENLQYLTKKENQVKFTRNMDEAKEYFKFIK